MNRCTLPFALLLTVLFALPLTAKAEECWTGKVIKRGLDKEISDATHILDRPNRTGHFYGNTVRRIHYRGQVLARPRDIYNGARAFIRRR